MTTATLLIVEDDGILAANLESIIRELGYSVLGPVASGEEAIDLLDKHAADLVLMDIELAGALNGIETAERIGLSRDVPIVFLTGFSHDPLLDQARIVAPYGYLVKPVPERELAATVTMSLHRHALDRDLRESRKALAASEARYRYLFEQSPVGNFRISLEGSILLANLEFAKMLGCASTEEVVATFTDLKHQLFADPGSHQRFVDLLHMQGEVKLFNCQWQKKDGTLIWISMNARLSAAGAETGDFAVIDGFALDITERKRAEEELQESEEKYRLLHESAGLGIGYYTPDGVVISYNEIASRHMNGRPEDFKGKSIHDLFPQEAALVYMERIKKAIISEAPQVYEDRVELPAKVAWYLSTFTRIVDASGTLLGVQIISNDISERKQAEEALRMSRQMSNDIIQFIPTGFFIYQYEAPDRLILLSGNPEAERLTGIRTDQWAGREFNEIWPEAAQLGITAQYLDVVQTGIMFETEDLHYSDLRLTGAFRIHAFKLPEDRLAVAFEDITERKRTEEALRKSEEKFRAAFDEDSIGRTLTGIDGRLIQTNPRFCAMLGYSPEEIATLSFTDLTHPDDTAASKEGVRCLLAGEQEIYRLEKRYLHKDGTPIWAEMTTTLLRDEQGSPRYFITGILDISERRRASEALRESETNHKLVLGMMQESLSVIDGDGNFLLANITAARNLTGGDAKELVGKNIRQLVPEEQSYKLLAMYRQALDSGTPLVQEVLVSLPEGDRWFYNTLYPLEYGERKTRALLSVSLDITERKRAEEAVTQANKLLQTIINAAPIRIFYKDRKLRYMGCNIAFAKDAGFSSPEDLIGKNDYQLGWKDQAELYRADDLRVIESGVPKLSYDEPQTNPEGELIWLRTSKVPLLNASNQIFGVLGMYEDISDSKRAEVALRESEERFKALHNASFGGIAIHDSGVILQCNQGLAEISGYSIEELVGMDGLLLISEKTRDLVLKNILDGYEKPYEATGLRKNNDEYPLRLEARNIPYRGKNVRVVEFRDITEAKQAEAERENLQAQLQQAQKLEAIGTLAGGIAHDFNNILGAIVGYSEMIHDDFPPGAPGIHNINQVLKASHRAKDLVKQILAFSRQVEDQKISMHPAVIVKEAITLLRSSLPTTISITQDIDADAGMVLANPTQIHQIVMNLATNAFHAMEVKGGILSISLQKRSLSQEDLAAEPGLQPGAFVQLSIRDSGEGIPPEIRERIFDPFFTTKEVGKGTGLGLSMVYSIVKGCQGSISCESRLGEGTAFRILLPILEGHFVEENQPMGFTPHGKEHILFIDDEEMLVELGQAMLERLGYRVTTRSNSLDALTTFQNQPDAFDLIITDQTMAGMTGVDLARRILQIRPDMPIILCTGYSSQISEEKAKAAGIKGFAYKPLAKKDIGELIRKVLDGKKSLGRS
jgi:PAS domain S-box-containing protein